MLRQGKLFAIILVLIITFALSLQAQTVESGSLLTQLPSAGPMISVTQLPEAKEYEKFEKRLTANISSGAKLFSIIDDFDYEVAGSVAEKISSKIFKLVFLEDKYIPKKKDYLPRWAMPIYDYAEGIPEGRLIGYSNEPQPYERVNEELRGAKSITLETIDWVARMRSALTHLPKFEGISFRGVRLVKERADKLYQTGKLMNDPAFISTSISPSIALRFAFPMYNLVPSEYQKLNIIMVVKGRTGRPISALADDHDDEDEILFANGTQFRVIAKSALFKLPEVQGRNQVIVVKEE